MLIFALAIPTGAPKSSEWFAKFILIAVAYAIIGYGAGFYMIMVINMANTVEYNEWKYGQRNESLIFSLRPFTAKLSSALTQALVIGVYAVASITTYTNAISNIENEASKNLITNKVKMEKITGIIKEVSLQDRQILVSCMCIIPVVFMIVALIIYKKKCTLSETRLAEMVRETEARKRTSPSLLRNPLRKNPPLQTTSFLPCRKSPKTSKTPPLTPRTTNNQYSIRNKKRSLPRERFF